MGIRPNVCYRKLERPYTRRSAKVQKKDFIPGVPGKKINQFDMGKQSPGFDTIIELVSRASANVRENALESARIVCSRHLDKVGVTNFYIKILTYPHHVLRENPLATGAGADRFQEGMRRAFGKPIGTAARVMNGDTIMRVRTNRKYMPQVKLALEKCAHKIGAETEVVVIKTSKADITPKILEIPELC
ncbi:MAG: 50S ribosomal protein L16 [archaeon]